MSLTTGLRRQLITLRLAGDHLGGGRPGDASDRLHDSVDALDAGCRAALEAADAKGLHWQLSTAPRTVRATAYEGAGMGLAALDLITPRRDRVGHFSVTYAGPYRYHLHLGVGMALARRRRSPEERLPWLDPLLGWAAADGYGFHATLFQRRRPLVAPPGWTPFARHLFDQGVGRALWMSLGTDSGNIRREVRALAEPRRGAVWCGLALAAAYTGGSPEQFAALREAAGRWSAELALGASLAAWARASAASPTQHTEDACRIFTGQSADTLATIAESARAALPVISPMPLMKLWRQRIAVRVDHLTNTSLSRTVDPPTQHVSRDGVRSEDLSLRAS